MKKRVYLFILVFTFIFLPSNIFAKTINVKNENEFLNALNSYTSEDQIVLSNDITYNAKDTLTIAKELTIDLNGHDLNYSFNVSNGIVVSKSALTIRNSMETGEFNLINNYSDVYEEAILVDGVLVFSDVKVNYTSSKSYYMVYINDGKFYTDTTTITLNDSARFVVFNYVKGNRINYNLSDTNIYINSKNITNGAALTMGNADIKLSDVVIKTNDISATYTGISVSDDSVLEIDGNSVIDLSSITDKKLYGIKATSSKVIINNILIKTNDYKNSNSIYNSGSTFSIIDGEFYNIVKPSTSSITGGKYKVQPGVQYLKEGSAFKLNEETGFYEVVSGKYEARIGDVGFVKIEDAISSTDKATIYIMSDIDEIVIPQNKKITLYNLSKKKVNKIINNGELEIIFYDLLANIENKGTLVVNKKVASIVNDGLLTIKRDGVISGTLTNNATIDEINLGTYLDKIINNGTINKITGGSFKDITTIKSLLSSDYDIYKTYNSTYGELNSVFAKDDVEAISNGYYYTSYKTASLNATKNNPAKLLKNIVKDSDSLYDGEYYLDLNNYNMTFSGKTNGYGMSLSGAKLYIMGTGVIDFTGTDTMFYVRGSYSETVHDFTALNIGENVTVNALNGMGAAMYTSGGKDKYGVNVTINGTINAATTLYVNGQYEISNENGPVFNVTKTAKLNGPIYAAGYATWNIEGNVTGDSAIYIKTGILNVTDGVITGTGEKSEYKYDGSGMYTTGDALVVDNSFSTSPVINITGGTFNSTNASAVGSYAYNNKTGLVDNRLALTKLLKGGNYNTDISNLIADNYYYRVENNRWYVEAYDRDIEINVIEENKKVDEITIGVTDREEAKDIIISSLESNEELKDVIANKNVDIKVEVDAISPSDEVKENIISKLNKDSKIIGYFDISIGIYEKNSNTKIGNLKELNDKMNITIALPSEYQNTNKKYNRTYYIIREHDGVYESIPAVVSNDGLYVTFKTDKFSTYAVAYTDTLNPQTSDDILLYTALSIICLSGLLVAYKYRKNFNN